MLLFICRFNFVRAIEEVKELLKGHKDLILGFNFFLPKGYEIKLPLEMNNICKRRLMHWLKLINFCARLT